ncbi:MAG: nucleotidyltransferase family protein [Eubacteriales bacterium]|nr:nucleotidyltransferase family protein [Eubacteriales bacterium]
MTGYSTVGIVAEYDPFHNGHERQILLAKEKTGAKYVAAVISCSFSQRGSLHTFSNKDRAEMALLSGADIVLGLPFSFGTAQANRFALGGVYALSQLKAIDTLCFGVEEKLLPYFNKAEKAIQNPLYLKLLEQYLKQGHSVAKAQGLALTKMLNIKDSSILNAPNFILGLCYIEALKKLKSDIKPLAVPRPESYIKSKNPKAPSASVIRRQMLQGDWRHSALALPETSLKIAKQAFLKGNYAKPQALDNFVLGKILSLDLDSLLNTPEISEGLENRFLSGAKSTNNIKELIIHIKTKRYTYSRLQRALAYIAVGTKKQELPEVPQFVRLLGFRKSSEELFKSFSKNIKIIGRPAKESLPREDIYADMLWQLAAGQEAAKIYTEPIVII